MYLPKGIYGAWILFFVSARTNKRHHHLVAFTGGSFSWSVMVLICGSMSWGMVLQLSAHVLTVVEHGVTRCSTTAASA